MAADTRRARILLIGSGGQVGRELARTLPTVGDLLPLDRAALDLTDFRAVREAVRDAGADIVVNAAAYTNVDHAESERAVAQAVNGDAPAAMADAARQAGALMVHYSTDFVFDGALQRPYIETDATNPVNEYGRSKLRGEQAVLGADCACYVFRVAWVYSAGGRGFLSRIGDLARERGELRVVTDEVGTPTWARPVAEATTDVVTRWLSAARGIAPPLPMGLFHMASPDAASRYDFATEVVRLTTPDGARRPAIIGVKSAEFPAAAPRPPWCVLDSSRLRNAFGITLPLWRQQLADSLQA